jgi:O-antigen/teichoic acid export membrane protein
VRHLDQVARLATLAVAGQGIAFVLSVTVARSLGVDGFEAYAVASASFILMVTLAPLGMEKYALRVLPALCARGDWSDARAFVRYGLRRTLISAAVIALAVGTWAWWVRDFSATTRLAVLISCVSLPAGALVHFGLEVLSAVGREVRALALFRVAVPLMTLALVGLVLASPVALSGALAIACWGIAWMLALALMAREFRRGAPPALFQAQTRDENNKWARESRPFLVYRGALGLLAQAGVIALDLLQPSATAVGAYAAAMGTAGLAVVLATATNRIYSRRLSILLERREFEKMRALRRDRLKWLLPALCIYLLVVISYPRELLTLFRPEFVEDGVNPLRLLAVAIVFCVFFALAPTYLKYRRRDRATYILVASATIAQGLLLVLLVPHYGAMGAAIAYAASTCGMYGAFAWMAHSELGLRGDRDQRVGGS